MSVLTLSAGVPRLAGVVLAHVFVLMLWPNLPATAPMRTNVVSARILGSSQTTESRAATKPKPAVAQHLPKPAAKSVPIHPAISITTHIPAANSVVVASVPVPPTSAPVPSTLSGSGKTERREKAESGGADNGPLTPARFDAAYLHNPKPEYPPASRRGSEEGKVLLRVSVGTDGSAQSVEVISSSGFSRLDQAAMAAVRRWRFAPARRGETPVEGNVRVPINFSLEDNS